MKLLISGEGHSDIGACNNAQGECLDSAFEPGPMAIWLNRLWQAVLGYNLLATPGAVTFISESALDLAAKNSRGRMQASRGKKQQVETRLYFNNAKQLGLRAKAMFFEFGTPVVAVLFRDTDGTRSTPGMWRPKWESMLNGFQAAEFDFGVPMLPKPKSEGWVLCALQKGVHSYEALEDISGNDKSPNSAKTKLREAMGGHKSATELADWCLVNPNDWTRLLTLPSFKAFLDRFNHVASAIVGPQARQH